MPMLSCRNRVSDFDRWTRRFSSHADAHREAGLRLVGIWRGLEEPDRVFFLFEVASMEKAREFMADPEAGRAGEEAGVIDGEYHFVEEPRDYAPRHERGS